MRSRSRSRRRDERDVPELVRPRVLDEAVELGADHGLLAAVDACFNSIMCTLLLIGVDASCCSEARIASSS